jgi:hypothetical protein
VSRIFCEGYSVACMTWCVLVACVEGIVFASGWRVGVLVGWTRLTSVEF